MDLLIGYLKAFSLEMGVGIRWERVRTCDWVIASARVRTIGEGGQTFATSVRMH